VIGRMERGELPPADSVASAEVCASERRHNRAYVRKPKADTTWTFDSLDFAKLL